VLGRLESALWQIQDFMGLGEGNKEANCGRVGLTKTKRIEVVRTKKTRARECGSFGAVRSRLETKSQCRFERSSSFVLLAGDNRKGRAARLTV